MKRKRSPNPSQTDRSTTPPATSMHASHVECPLLLLPREFRDRILRYLLYTPKALGMEVAIKDDRLKRLSVRPNERTFTFHPAILRVSRQFHDEGKDILYCQNTATAVVNLEPEDEYSTVECLDNLISLDKQGVAVACRFVKWDVTIRLDIQIPKDTTNIIFDFVSGILRAIPNLNRLKVRLHLWDNLAWWDLISFVDPRDFEDIAEQILRPFPAIRARKAEFVDKNGHLIRAALSLSTLIMGDTSPPPITLHELFDDLVAFLDHSLSEQSRSVFKARLAPLEIACDLYEVDVFRATLRSLLAYLDHSRRLVPPKHLTEFAQTLASGEISTICPLDGGKNTLGPS